MLDYHLHLWPHHEHDTALRPEQLTEYCEQAELKGTPDLLVTVPYFDADIYDMGGLLQLGAQVWH